jgi:4-amino-4-deoxy-L-arabinose transferase-like glycosyltransferase
MNRARIVGVILLLASALVARLLPGPRTIDDAYITFRYARNLLGGEGFVYNPGEYVMGTTTPLYTLMLSGVAVFFGGEKANFPLISLIINALADALTCLLLWQIGKRLGSETAGAAAGVIWAVAPFSVTFAIGGLETSLYVMLLTATFYFYLCKYEILTGLTAAAVFLTRVDGVILLGPLGLFWLVRALQKKERISWRVVLAAGLPVVLWLVFAGFYFGSPIPQTIQAKLVAYRLEPNASLMRLLQHYATPFFEYNLIGPAASVGIGLVLYPFLAVLGMRRALKVEPRSLPWLLYPWLYFIAFSLPNPLIFRWYLTPPLAAWILLIFLGAGSIIASLRGSSMVKRLLAGFLLVLVFGLTMSEWRLHPDHGLDRPAPDMAYIKLELLYEQAAEIINPYLQAGDVLAAGDVGVLGYMTGGRIYDLVGLNTPQVTRYYPLDPDLYAINYAVAPNSILDEQPDAVIILEVYGRKGLLLDSRFSRQYSLLEKIETDMYGSDGLLIFVKKQ